jgi:hypothetical protein
MLSRTMQLARAELTLVVTVFIVGGGLWGFVGLAEEVNEGETESFDRAIILALRNPLDLSILSGRPGSKRRCATSPRWAAPPSSP